MCPIRRRSVQQNQESALTEQRDARVVARIKGLHEYVAQDTLQRAVGMNAIGAKASLGGRAAGGLRQINGTLPILTVVLKAPSFPKVAPSSADTSATTMWSD